MAHPQEFDSTHQMVTELVASNGAIVDNNKNVGKMDERFNFDTHRQTRHNHHHPFNQRQSSSLVTSYNQQNLLHSSTLTSKRFDVRMRRHPELQPFVPSDRVPKSTFVGSLSSGPASTSTAMTANTASSSTRGHPKRGTNFRLNVNVNGNGNSDVRVPSGTKTKKCVSMTRLDQLARPRRIFSRVAPSTHSTPANNNAPISTTSNSISLASASSSAPFVTSSASTCSEESAESSTTPSQAHREEEELRLKTEAELKEVAKRDEQERQSRQLYLDSILSKFNISQGQ